MKQHHGVLKEAQIKERFSFDPDGNIIVFVVLHNGFGSFDCRVPIPSHHVNLCQSPLGDARVFPQRYGRLDGLQRFVQLPLADVVVGHLNVHKVVRFARFEIQIRGRAQLEQDNNSFLICMTLLCALTLCYYSTFIPLCSMIFFKSFCSPGAQDIMRYEST